MARELVAYDEHGDVIAQEVSRQPLEYFSALYPYHDVAEVENGREVRTIGRTAVLLPPPYREPTPEVLQLFADAPTMKADIDEFMRRLGPRWFLEQNWFPASVRQDDEAGAA